MISSTSPSWIERLQARLGDQRSRRLVVLSHCLLNQNVRYLGGAWTPGVAADVVEPLIRDGVGFYQLPCPEQVVWGGVLKRLVLSVYGARGLYRWRALLFPLFRLYTRWRYGRLARAVAHQLADYARSGFEIVELVGVGDSPSCGLRHTLDLARALPIIASLDRETIEPQTFNAQAVRACLVEGEGLFMEALRRQLAARGLSVVGREYLPPTV